MTIEETRRTLLGKTALVAGGFGLAGLNRPSAAGAVPTTLRGYNDVKDFGATGDGTTDDRAAIQAAIDASAVDPASGQAAAVYFPPGVYLVGSAPPPSTSSLFLPSSSVLIGHGPLSVIKRTVPRGAILINKTGGSDIHVENLTLDGGWSGTENDGTGTTYLILMQSAQRIFIRGVEGRRNGYFAFGIGLRSIKVGAVQDCHLHHCNRDGIHVDRLCEDVIVQGNLLHDCGDDHIAASGKRTSVLGNICNANATPRGSAIAVRGGEQIKIVGNLCRGGARAGIEVSSTPGVLQDVQVCDNLIVEAGNIPDLAPGVTPLRTVGNGTGILMGAAPTTTANSPNPVRRVKVTGNLISAPRNHGISFTSSSSQHGISDVDIAANRIWCNRQATYLDDQVIGSGIVCTLPYQVVADVRIAGNDVRDMRGAGIAVTRHPDAPRPRRLDILHNQVLDSGTAAAPASAIVLDGVQDVTVSGNRAQDSRGAGRAQKHGLELNLPEGAVVITGNTFTDNQSGAVLYTHGPPGPAHLRIRDNPGFDPWTGEVTVDAGSWQPSGGALVRDKAVGFAVPFPGGRPPKISITPADGNAHSAAALAVTSSGFTARAVFVGAAEPPPPVLRWLAEP